MRTFILPFIILFSLNTYAISFDVNQRAFYLVDSCQQYTELYNENGQKKWWSVFTTSREDALRIGYCLGVIEQVQRGELCPNGIEHYKIDPTYAMASAIARMENSEVLRKDTNGTIRKALCPSTY